MDHNETRDKHHHNAIASNTAPVKPLHANARRSKDRLANLRRLERFKRLRKRRGLSPRQLWKRKLSKRTVIDADRQPASSALPLRPFLHQL